ncbi:MAG: clostripain-related cysteine peptidase [Candidatus Brocadiales bacterium]
MRLCRLLLISLLVLCALTTKGFCGEGHRAKWTCIIYLAGDNFLDWFTVQNLEEMRRAGSSYDVRVVVLADRTDKRGHLFEVRKGYLVGLPLEEIRPDWKDKEINTGDPRTLSAFASWAVENLPAENYFILLGGYGEGWTGLLHDFDDGTGTVDILSLDEMEVALADIAKSIKKTNGKDSIDILGLDSCYMGMVEVLYQIGDSARYVIVSENEEALDGWPYDEVIGAFVRGPDRPAWQLASSVVDAYVETVQGERADKINNILTASLIDMRGFKRLIPLLEALALELSDLLPLEIKDIFEVDRLTNTFTVSAHIAGRYVPYSVHYDLGDFLTALMVKFKRYPSIFAKAQDIRKALAEAVIRERHQDLVYRKLSLGGLTIYSLGAELEAYSKLPFSRRTHWNNFVEAKLKPLEKAAGKGG